MKKQWFATSILMGGVLFSGVLWAALSGSLDEKAIAERLKPEGEVTVVADDGSTVVKKIEVATADIGEATYKQVCQMCHAEGLAGAPKFKDKEAWKPRIAEGIETLIKHALEGIRVMPAKGGCATCTNEEIQKAVEYMVSHSK